MTKENVFNNKANLREKKKYDKHEPSTSIVRLVSDLGQANKQCGGIEHACDRYDGDQILMTDMCLIQINVFPDDLEFGIL